MRHYVVAIVLLCLASAGVAQENHNRIVYWGNTETGKAVRVANKLDAEKIAEAQVKAIGGTGWVLYENSSVPGFGAAICTRSGKSILFHTAHGYPTTKEAVRAASAKAKASGGTTSFCSNALWLVNGSLPAEEPTLMDAAKEAVRDLVVKKQVKKNECPVEEGTAAATVEGRRHGERLKDVEGDSETCSQEERHSNDRLGCMCVRG